MSLDKEVEVPPILPCLQQHGLGEFLDTAFSDIIWERRDDIHEIVDAIIARNKRGSGKGGTKAGRKSTASGSKSSGAPVHTLKDPKVVPPAADVRHNAVLSRSTRSDIEPITERLDSAATVGDLFEAAAKDCRAAVRAIIEQCKKERKMFFDDSFYFDKRRNLYPDGSPDDCTVPQPKKCKRLRDLYPTAPLFSNDVACDDVLQGSVGDCFFIGAVSALAATNPGQLRRLFVEHDVSCGVYGVMFYKCGGWEWVIVDDNIPVQEERSGNCYPLFACPGAEHELWPMILEKAYAKMHYNWDIIDGGFAKEALVDLTGGLEYTYDFYREDKNTTFQQFKEDVDDPYTILGCAVGDHVEADASKKGGAGEEGAVFGLFHGHQYSVIDITQTSDGTGFVKVRNPWGNEAEFTGPYSDNSIEWKQNPQHKKELNPTFADDGTFWMRWNDFFKLMTQVDVVRTFPDDWRVLTMFGKGSSNPGPEVAYILQVSENTTKLAVTFSQDDPKMVHNSDTHVKQYLSYNTIKMTIYKLRQLPKSDEEFEDAVGKKKDSLKVRERSVYTIDNFEPGLYCITPLMSKGELQGMYLRVVGPPDADYALWRWKDGEASRQVVGNCPLQSVSNTGAVVASPPPQQPATPLQAPAPVAVQPPPPSSPAPPATAGPKHVDFVGGPPSPIRRAESPNRSGGAASSREIALQRELSDAQDYIKQLEKLLRKQQDQIDAFERAQPSRPLQVQQPPLPPTPPPIAAPAKTPKQRLGLDGERFEDVVDEVFFEVAGRNPTIDKKAALNALRLIVTLGAGMDDVAAQQPQLADAAAGGVSREAFHALCKNVVESWPVLQQ